MSDRNNESVEEETAPGLAYALSLVVALATGALPNYCYANAWHAITECTELQEARLVEGWMVLEQETQVSLIEHAWCDCEGLIVDPSIVLCVRREQPIFYFPGIWRDQAEIETLACHELPYVRSVGTYGPDGMGHADYRAAYHAAYARASSSAAAHHPPKPLIVQPSTFPSTDADRTRCVVRIVSSGVFLRGEP